MTFFLDANVLVYSAVPSPRRARCVALLEAVADARADGRTSAACLEEVWYLETTRRIAGLDGLTARAYTLLTPLLAVTDDAFRRALSLRASGIGTNDRLHAATCQAYGIETIVSADEAFDSVTGLRRVDPGDEAGVGALMGPG